MRATSLSLIAALASVLSLAPELAVAQTYPSRPIRLVVPFDPGGPTDILARGVGARMGEGLGATVAVENRSGASTIIGAEIVAKSAPDGYTLFLTTGTAVSINQHMFKKLPYSPDKDFTAVGYLGANPYGMFANPSVPASTFKDLLAYTKVNPGKLNVGMAGAGTPTHFAWQMLELASGARFTAVQYKGNNPALIDVLSGRIELMLSSPVLMLPHVKTGKLKALAVTSPARTPQLPDVPAMSEFYPGVEAETWFGIMAPAGTPRNIIVRINAQMQNYTADPASRDKMLGMGMLLNGGTPEQLAAYIKAETERWGTLIRKLGLTLE